MSDHTDQLDMEFVRGAFPALAKDWAFFDNAGGSQTLQGAMDRIVEFLTHRDVQIGGSYEISQLAAEALMDGRRAAPPRPSSTPRAPRRSSLVLRPPRWCRRSRPPCAASSSPATRSS